MSVLDIVLIIIGFILVAISYYVSEKIPAKQSEDNQSTVTELWGEKEEVTIKDRVKSIVSDKSEEVIETVEDRLCHLSNEKIMEFKEYSDQVMESVKQEHKQTVFLYNMLNEKEASIKGLLNELDIKYAVLSDKINVIGEKAEVKNSVNKANSKAAEREVQKKTVQKPVQNSNLKQSAEKPMEQKQPKDNKKINVSVKKEKAGPDRNDRILSLWKQGKTVLDISRQLGIGQGEVKLVIDLYKGV